MKFKTVNNFLHSNPFMFLVELIVLNFISPDNTPTKLLYQERRQWVFCVRCRNDERMLINDG